MPREVRSKGTFSRCRWLKQRTKVLLGILLVLAVLCGCGRKQWHYAAPVAPSLGKDFDARWDPNKLDPNGSPRNVDWAPQLQGRLPNPDECGGGNPQVTACTEDKPFLDPPNVFTWGACFLGKVLSGKPFGFFGHEDWTVAQYDGSLGWLNYNRGDFDYDLVLVPGEPPGSSDNQHGMTTNNNQVGNKPSSPRYLELEFDSRETDGVFGNGWWSDFRKFGHDFDPDHPEDLQKLLHPSDPTTLACGSAVGVFDLDCDHGCRSELHPIYALALQLAEDRSDNQWSVLVRNWGSGGFCSKYNDELAESSLSLALPYSSIQEPLSVEITEFQSAGGLHCPKAYFTDGHVILNFVLPKPEARSLAAMKVKVTWPDGAKPLACPSVNTAELVPLMREETRRKNVSSGEEYIAELLKRELKTEKPDFENQVLQMYLQNPKNQQRMRKLQTVAVSNRVSQNCGIIPVVAGAPQKSVASPGTRLKEDEWKKFRDAAVLSIACQGLKDSHFQPTVGTRQDLDRACKSIKFGSN